MNDEHWIRTENNCFIHKTAIVEPWVKLGKNCKINPYTVIGRLPQNSLALARRPHIIRELNIGSNVEIGCHSIVFGGVQIGDDTFVGDFAHIREQVTIGKRCVIGRGVMISYESIIGDDCRFQDQTVLTGIVGNGCFFGVGVITSNDRNIDLEDYHYDKERIRLPKFGEKVMVGSGSNILAGVEIGDSAVIGAGSLVTKNVKPHEKVLGWKCLKPEELKIISVKEFEKIEAV